MVQSQMWWCWLLWTGLLQVLGHSDEGNLASMMDGLSALLWLITASSRGGDRRGRTGPLIPAGKGPTMCVSMFVCLRRANRLEARTAAVRKTEQVINNTLVWVPVWLSVTPRKEEEKEEEEEEEKRRGWDGRKGTRRDKRRTGKQMTRDLRDTIFPKCTEDKDEEKKPFFLSLPVHFRLRLKIKTTRYLRLQKKWSDWVGGDGTDLFKDILAAE